MKNIFLLLILSICTSCSVDKIGLFSRNIGVYERYDQALNGIENELQKSNNSFDQMAYILLQAIAYHRQNKDTKSFKSINLSIATNSKYNYYSYQYLAYIYKSKGNYSEEKKALINASQCINNLMVAIEKQILSENKIEKYISYQFYLGYYVYKNKDCKVLASLNKGEFIIFLKNKKNNIKEKIRKLKI